jgi:hypothetical protein
LLTSFWNALSRANRWCAGSFIFCEAEAFRAVGGFSDEHYVSEEIHLSKRLKALARQKGRRMTILHRHPLITSSRKMQLYSQREHLRFIFQLLWRPGRVVRERDNCTIWYDGRR